MKTISMIIILASATFCFAQPENTLDMSNRNNHEEHLYSLTSLTEFFKNHRRFVKETVTSMSEDLLSQDGSGVERINGTPLFRIDGEKRPELLSLDRLILVSIGKRSLIEDLISRGLKSEDVDEFKALQNKEYVYGAIDRGRSKYYLSRKDLPISPGIMEMDGGQFQAFARSPEGAAFFTITFDEAKTWLEIRDEATNVAKEDFAINFLNGVSRHSRRAYVSYLYEVIAPNTTQEIGFSTTDEEVALFLNQIAELKTKLGVK